MGVLLTLIKVVFKKNHEMGGTMLPPLWETLHTVTYGPKLCCKCTLGVGSNNDLFTLFSPSFQNVLFVYVLYR